MRTHVTARRLGSVAADHWVEVGVIPVSSTGAHYNGRVSTDGEGEAAGRVELRGQAGVTVLWKGPIGRAATLVPMPVTLPGDRLVLVAQVQKRAAFTFELAWIEPGEQTPPREDEPCART